MTRCSALLVCFVPGTPRLKIMTSSCDSWRGQSARKGYVKLPGGRAIYCSVIDKCCTYSRPTCTMYMSLCVVVPGFSLESGKAVQHHSMNPRFALMWLRYFNQLKPQFYFYLLSATTLISLSWLDLWCSMTPLSSKLKDNIIYSSHPVSGMSKYQTIPVVDCHWPCIYVVIKYKVAIYSIYTCS